MTQAEGDFATILYSGDPVSGAILLIGQVRGQDAKIFERFPSLDGRSAWSEITLKNGDDPAAMHEYMVRRRRSDPDLWVIELDVATPERLNLYLGKGG